MTRAEFICRLRGHRWWIDYVHTFKRSGRTTIWRRCERCGKRDRRLSPRPVAS